MNASAPIREPSPTRRDFERDLIALQPYLRGIARSLTRDATAAEDLAQDTLVKALTAWESYTPGTNMKAWTSMILRNQFYSEKRRSWRSSPLDQEVAERVRDTVMNQAEAEELRQEFCAIAPLLGYLPSDARDSVIAIKFVGMQYEEAALALDTEVGTVKSRVSRGLDMLRAAVDTRLENVFDLSAWATASADVPQSHAYFPIAKAYEEIYAYLRTRPRCSLVSSAPASSAQSTLDKLWAELKASDDLEDERLDDLMRYDDEPY